jgi:hypothetical protein
MNHKSRDMICAGFARIVEILNPHVSAHSEIASSARCTDLTNIGRFRPPLKIALSSANSDDSTFSRLSGRSSIMDIKACAVPFSSLWIAILRAISARIHTLLGPRPETISFSRRPERRATLAFH